jgi:C-terminal processing protease CtpA/Prc
MKTILTKSLAVAILLGSILAACTGAPSRQLIPTETVLPTIPPTSTVSPAPVPLLLGKYELLSPDDMRHDLDELFYQIEHVHPNPYTKRPKSDVDREKQRLYDELGEPMTLIDFYRKVDPLVNSLGDRHTYVLLPDDVEKQKEKYELLFPLDVKMSGEKGLIIGNYSDNPDVPVGGKLLSINGIPISSIPVTATSFFPYALWWSYGSLSEYRVEILPEGDTTPVIFDLQGITQEEIDRNFPVVNTEEQVSYRKIPNEPVGVLTVSTFTGIGPLLKPAFTKIKDENIQNLIIDVRTNGGGRDISPLMDYLTDQPYTLCSRSYKAPFGGYGTGAPRESGFCKVIEPFDTEERFQGRIYLLIGPYSFSAAIIFGNILQDYRLATLIGEETRDTASFCAMPSQSELPRTKLVYEISTECFVRPSGVLDEKPLVPDISIETTLQDRLNGKDPVLDYTLEIIRNGGPTP